MPNQIRATLLQTRRSTSFRAALAACSLGAIAYLWIAHAVATGTLTEVTGRSGQGVSDVFLVMLLGSLLAGTIVCTDFETKTMHDAVLATHRASIVAARTVVFTLAVMLLTLPFGIAASVALAAGAEVAPILPTTPILVAMNPSGPELGPQTLFRLLLIVGVTGLVYAAQLSVCIPFGFWIRRPVAVMAFGFVVAFILSTAHEALAEIDQLRPIQRASPFAYSGLSLESSTGTLVAAGCSSVAALVLMSLVAWVLFRRADVK